RPGKADCSAPDRHGVIPKAGRKNLPLPTAGLAGPERQHPPALVPAKMNLVFAFIQRSPVEWMRSLPMVVETNGTGTCKAPELAMSVNSRSWTEVELRRSAEVEPLLEQVVAAMVAQDYSHRTCWEMRLALEEAIVNGLRHGNRFDPTK